MSFSLEIKKELSELKMKKGCCRFFFLCGLSADAQIDGECRLKVKTTVKEVRDEIVNFVHFVCHTEPTVTETVNLCAPVYYVEYESEKVVAFLRCFEDGEINANCDNCTKSFIRAAFVSCGTISEPASGYHLEVKFKNIERAKSFYKLLSDEGIEPKIVNRRGSVGLYYKNSGVIEDVLTYLGAVNLLFEFINTKIEREIRNSVNRSTNCVAGNIAKSVSAARRQVETITALGEEGFLMQLPDELFETAKLRLEYPSAPLSELAIRHTPPISKSGLTHRLAKIMDFAEEKGIVIENK